MYTRCPHCHTTFRVQASQIRAAQGLVRCGHCQATFQALDYLFDKPAVPSQGETQLSSISDWVTEAARQEEGPSDTVITAVEPLAAEPEPTQEPPTPITEESAQEPVPEEPAEPLPGQLESLEALFAAQHAESEGTAEATPPAPVSTAAPRGFQYEPPEPEPMPEEPMVPWAPATVEAPPTPQAPSGFRFEPPEPEPAPPSAEVSPALPPANESIASVVVPERTPAVSEEVPSGVFRWQNLPDAASRPTSGEAPSEAFAAALREMQGAPAPSVTAEPEPSTLPPTASALPGLRDTIVAVAWGIGSLALALLLALQFAYFQRNELARDPLLRPALQTMCDRLGCKLPLREDLTLIRLQDRDVRNHPSLPSALMISAVIVNSGDFMQPYPDLEVSFKNLQDVLVGKRRFTPAEYLRDVKLGAGFAPHQRLTAVLEIVDPGPTAINYNLDIRAGRQPAGNK